MGAKKKGLGKSVMVRPELREGISKEEEDKAIGEAAEALVAALQGEAEASAGPKVTSMYATASFIAWKTSCEASYAWRWLAMLQEKLRKEERAIALIKADRRWGDRKMGKILAARRGDRAQG